MRSGSIIKVDAGIVFYIYVTFILIGHPVIVCFDLDVGEPVEVIVCEVLGKIPAGEIVLSPGKIIGGGINTELHVLYCSGLPGCSKSLLIIPARNRKVIAQSCPGHLPILVGGISRPDKAAIMATLHSYQIPATMVKTNIV